MINSFNIDKNNLFVMTTIADLRTVINEINEEWAKKLAEVEKEAEKKEWISSRDTAKMLNKSISTINRWKHSGYLTARTIGGMDYYSRKEIELKLGAA
jgi:hypothetical protein